MTVFQTLFQLCLFRGSPASLPLSTFWLGLIIGLNALMHFAAIVSKSPLPAGQDLLYVVISFVLLISVFYSLLKFKNLSIRFHKGLMAYLGTEIILMVCLFILSNLVVFFQGNPISLIFAILLIFLAFWKFAVLCYVVRFTFDSKIAMAILMVILFEFMRAVPFLVVQHPIIMANQQGVS